MTLILILALLFQRPPAPFHNPNDADDPKQAQKYRGILTVPKDGHVAIPFIRKFAIPPSCWFSGATIPGERPVITERSVTLNAKPGGKIKWACHGIRGGSK